MNTLLLWPQKFIKVFSQIDRNFIIQTLFQFDRERIEMMHNRMRLNDMNHYLEPNNSQNKKWPVYCPNLYELFFMIWGDINR